MILLAVLNIILSFIGVRRGFKTKSFIIFVWLIVFYYSITSLVSLLEYNSFPLDVRKTYVINMSLCIVAFLVSDFIFNRKKIKPIDLMEINKAVYIVRIIEIVFWISLILTYLELKTQDYKIYNSSEGQGGWAQGLFQVTSIVICYFIYQRKWWKIALASMFVIGMIASTGVRSLLYFILFPILFVYLNEVMSERIKITKIIIITIPLAVLLISAVVVVNMLRFGEVRLPETELTYISLRVIANGGYPLQYFNTCFHYFLGFTPPLINALNKLGLDISTSFTFLSPSIPRLNYFYISEYGTAHYPATIFHNCYMSFGYYGCIWAFVVFSYLKLLCDFFQKNTASFFSLSSVLGWHIYMIMRGAADGAASGISYAILMAVILYFIIRNSIKNYKHN